MRYFVEIPVILENQKLADEMDDLGIEFNDSEIGVAMIDLRQIISFYDNLEDGTNVSFVNGQVYSVNMKYDKFKSLMKDNGLLR